MADPAIIVPAGAHVSIELINADEDMAHGVVITASGATRSTMPMMTAGPALSGSALWFLGKPTAAGMHAGTLAFTAVTPGSCQYLFPATPPKACRRVYWQVSARPPPQRPRSSTAT